MKKSIVLLNILVFLFCLNILGQKPVIQISFTSVNNQQWVPIESIVIKNITRGVDTTIYYPDTVLVLHYQVGIEELYQPAKELTVFQNFPNPVKEYTTINIYVPDKGEVSISINDALGRQIIGNDLVLDNGLHSFKFTPGPDHLYFFNAKWKQTSRSIKIINENVNSGQVSYLEYENKSTATIPVKSTAGVQSFSFDVGDNLVFVANADNLESGIFDEPETDTSYIFQFATNIPCPDDSTVIYEGQTYHTIQVFSQCWFKENLNAGTMIPGNQEMEDNNTIEKYCYDDNEDNCNEYGGLYQWNELMQYTMTSGAQGICPDGWHVPTDDDWVILDGAVDSQYGIGDPEWYNSALNGFDAGLNLKSENGWSPNGNGYDLFGFTALPAGQRISNGYFDGFSYKASFWSSSEDYPGASWYRTLSYIFDGIDRSSQTNNWGKSVRCIRDK